MCNDNIHTIHEQNASNLASTYPISWETRLYYYGSLTIAPITLGILSCANGGTIPIIIGIAAIIFGINACIGLILCEYRHLNEENGFHNHVWDEIGNSARVALNKLMDMVINVFRDRHSLT
jgi:hypothetical protein